MNLYIFAIGIIGGFFTAKFFSAKKTGQRGRFKSIRFKIGENVLHIHHWLYSFIVLFVIGWVYLLHAYYRLEKIDYRYFEIVNKWRKAGMDFEELRVKAYWLITHQ